MTRPAGGRDRPAGRQHVLSAAGFALLATASLAALPLAALPLAALPTAGAAAASARGGAPRGPKLPPPVRCPACWRPALDTSWQWQLDNPPKAPFLAVDMYDVDGFETSAATVAALHESYRHRRVVCYIDAGTWEDFRPDAKEFPKSIVGKPVQGWRGEWWLDIRAYRGVLGRIMLDRIGMCERKGFDGIELDNVDGYTNKTGFPLTFDDQLRYDVFLANAAHRDHLTVLLKNDVGQIPRLLAYFDAALDEQCFQYEECFTWENGGFGLNQFVHAHKAVFEVEYNLPPSRFCPEADKADFNSMAKHVELGPWREPCRRT